MSRAVAVVLCWVLGAGLSACLSEGDPCEGVDCPEDRICIALSEGTHCACADPLVEVEGECVEEPAEGEGEEG